MVLFTSVQKCVCCCCRRDSPSLNLTLNWFERGQSSIQFKLTPMFVLSLQCLLLCWWREVKLAVGRRRQWSVHSFCLLIHLLYCLLCPLNAPFIGVLLLLNALSSIVIYCPFPQPTNLPLLCVLVPIKAPAVVVIQFLAPFGLFNCYYCRWGLVRKCWQASEDTLNVCTCVFLYPNNTVMDHLIGVNRT